MSPAETALLLAAVVVFVLGTIYNLAEPITTALEPWYIDELFLALPLVILALVLAQRRQAHAWQYQETRFRTLVEQLPAAVYLLAADEEMTPVYASPTLETLTGYPPHEVLDSARWLTFVHPHDRDRAAAEDAKIIETHEPFRLDYRLVRKDGGIVWVRDECVPMRDATGTLVGWLGFIIDITDRVNASEAQSRLAAIVDSAEDAIFSSDLEGHITSWNRGAERLYGYQAAEIVGQSFAVLLPDTLDDPLLAERIASARAGAPAEPFETVRRRRDGSPVDVAIALSPICDHVGTVIGLASITRDMTEWKALEAELRAALEVAESANMAKSQFLAMMSHELRTPLQAVLGYAEFLLANADGRFTSEEREDLGYIQQGGKRMFALINQLLDLSRLEAGRLDVAHEPVDLAVVVEEVRQDVTPQAALKELSLSIDLPATLPLVLGDEERLRQVLLNLVGNAVKFTERGTVTITAEKQMDAVAVIVRDTGIGMAPEALPHIFEAFRQVDSRLSRRHGGAGLGLAIAQGLAELMGGRIAVESTLGVGSTFTLTMLAAAPAKDSSAPLSVRLRN